MTEIRREGRDEMGQGTERALTTARAEVRAIARARRLADLLDRRPELEGVYAPADLTAEALRWSV